MNPKPIIKKHGGKKFFLPLIMKLPVVRYSPVGAVLDTCDWCTHHADVTILASQAAL